MTMYERKSMLNDALAKYEGEADMLFGFISDEETIVVIPHWEYEGDNPTSEVASNAARIADELSEGYIIGIYADKREQS